MSFDSTECYETFFVGRGDAKENSGAYRSKQTVQTQIILSAADEKI